MQKILVFTDIHIMKPGKTIIGLDPAARLREGLEHALENHPDAARVIITGDLTHFGSRVEYTQLKSILDTCPLPISMTMGNHDQRDTFRQVFPHSPTSPGGFVQSSVDFGAYRLILLDTLDGTTDPFHSGFLCDQRLSWLQEQLKTDKRVILFLHHPPIITGFRAMDHIGLRNRDQLAQMLGQHANVTQIIAGHVHRTISGSCAGIPTAIFKSPCHQAPMMLEDENDHSSVSEPGAYGLLLLGNDVIVHSEDFTLGIAPDTYDFEAEAKT